MTDESTLMITDGLENRIKDDIKNMFDGLKSYRLNPSPDWPRTNMTNSLPQNGKAVVKTYPNYIPIAEVHFEVEETITTDFWGDRVVDTYINDYEIKRIIDKKTWKEIKDKGLNKEDKSELPENLASLVFEYDEWW